MGKRRTYSPQVIEFIGKRSGDGSIEWMRGEIRERFGIVMTYGQLKSLYANHKFHAKPGAGQKKQRTFPPAVAKYIEDNCRGKSWADMAELLRGQFGIVKTPQQLKGYYNNHNLRTGTLGRFEKGHEPFYKGKKLPPEVIEKTRATQFKKGNRPQNAQPVGSESKVDGYWKVKIAEPNVWQLKSRHEWERIHGEKLRPSDKVLFLDKNADNFAQDNLVRVTAAELARINQDNLRGDNQELNMAAVNLARLKTKAKEKRGRKNEHKTES